MTSLRRRFGAGSVPRTPRRRKSNCGHEQGDGRQIAQTGKSRGFAACRKTANSQPRNREQPVPLSLREIAGVRGIAGSGHAPPGGDGTFSDGPIENPSARRPAGRPPVPHLILRGILTPVNDGVSLAVTCRKGSPQAIRLAEQRAVRNQVHHRLILFRRPKSTPVKNSRAGSPFASRRTHQQVVFGVENRVDRAPGEKHGLANRPS